MGFLTTEAAPMRAWSRSSPAVPSSGLGRARPRTRLPGSSPRRLAALLALAVLVLAACAAGPNAAVGADAGAGFWLGLWHGVILPITFVISLFTDDVTVYEVANQGNWYDAGFVLGLLVSLGGAGGSGAAAGRRR